ncbi:MAG TPA: hypothetical protein ENK34_07850 [Rhodobacteraceae bacterium]|nr:hypothetical protein [Paracoccaceae bacterium]
MTETIHDMAEEVSALMKERLSIRGRDLAAKLRHTGRMMPKRLKREAAYLAEAAQLSENPRLLKMIDMARVEAAHRDCLEFLKKVDVADRRKGVVLGILASLAMTFLMVSTLVIIVLVWRGYI